MKFEIKEEYLTDIVIHTKSSLLSNPDNPSNEDLLKILKGHHQMSMTSTNDHPEFAKLRDQLEELGYIKTERSWWNGDKVLKSFYLNGAKFKKHEQFPCGAAIKFEIKSKLKRDID